MSSEGNAHRSATLIRDPSFNPFGGFTTVRSPALSPDRISIMSPCVAPTRTGVSRTRFPSRRYANVPPFRSIRADRPTARRGFISSGARLRGRKETLALMSGSIRRYLSRKRTLKRLSLFVPLPVIIHPNACRPQYAVAGIFRTITLTVYLLLHIVQLCTFVVKKAMLYQVQVNHRGMGAFTMTTHLR